MQNALRHAQVSDRTLNEQRDLEAIEPIAGSIRVRISATRALVSRRLERLLGNASGIELLACPETGPVASGVPGAQPPVVLVLDGAELGPQERLRLQRTARNHHPARVLWLLNAAPYGSADIRMVLNAVKAGWCHGFVVCDSPRDTFVRAVTAVARRDIWLPRAMLVQALHESESLMAALGPAGAAAHGRNQARTLLTVREREILQQVRCGLTNKEVGRHLGIKEDTVKKHLRNMYAKLGVHRRAQMLLRSSKASG